MSYFLFPYLSFLIFRARWVEVVVSSQSEFTRNLDQNTLLLLLPLLLLQRLTGGFPCVRLCAECLLQSLNITLLATLLHILSLWMTKLRLRKAADDLPMLMPLATLRAYFWTWAWDQSLHVGPLLTVSSSGLPPVHLCSLSREEECCSTWRAPALTYRTFSQQTSFSQETVLWLSQHSAGEGTSHCWLRLHLTVLEQTLSPHPNLTSRSITTMSPGPDAPTSPREKASL